MTKEVMQKNVDVKQDNYVVNDLASFEKKLNEVKKAQAEFSKFTQEQVDKIFMEAALAANHKRIYLAKMAREETQKGIIEDKVIKNNYAAEYTYNAYKNTKTCGVIERDEAFGFTKIAEPVGVIAAVIPTTNPTSTAIYKTLLALKTRNGMIISPHPGAKKSTIEAAKIILNAAVKAGAPEGIIAWIDEPTIELSAEMMKEADLILATGGPGMVKSAYSSGKPAVGVGAGNVPAIIDESADIKTAVNSIVLSKSFDYGMICASEQSTIVHKNIYDKVKKEFEYRGAFVVKGEEIDKIRKIILKENGGLNANIVGKSPFELGKLAGVDVPKTARIILVEAEETDFSEPLAHEKLSPILAMYKAKDYQDAVDKAAHLVEQGGLGHTSSLYIDEVNNKDKVKIFVDRMKTGRVLINTPSSQGAIGDLYNFKLAPSLTLGCGSWGGNSVSENVGVKHLINIKTVAERRENMLWFRTPDKVYFKKGCLPVAMKEFKEVLNKKRAFIVTDSFLYNNGYIKAITDRLDEMGILYTTFYDVEPDPTLRCAAEGAKAMKSFEPDLIIAFGGGSAMDAAKIMWVMYEHPEANFKDMAMTFMDIRKRVYTFPKMGEKAYFCAVASTAGTGSEVTPFAVITDQDEGIKYPLADYELMPDMAIIDSDLMMDMPPSLAASSGFDAMTHALEAYVAMLRSEPADGMALQAGKAIFDYLPDSNKNGKTAIKSKEKMAIASSMAGMAFANAFLGVCHSMAHKLGAFHHVQHGVANSLLIAEVIKYNCAEAPIKMGTFPQYKYPDCVERYAEFARFCGVKEGANDRATVDNLLKALEDLRKEIGLPMTIKETGIDEKAFLDSLDEMSVQAFNDQCTGANPRYPLIEELKQMYLNAYYGK
ncbi:bifunctional acetaldehyde-CoA/alcohol dehydrogenase [Peptostreptococcus faecalis]|uniref:bifunctional acetaldehyde-CoA/alcohol dehydrogenase n=1 Tax=Peptostreptococcus faecalis TaxID=2045015 RepID=UPI000C7A608E|nr:bifunctional acetaldehyde-CoA/alcohol dehydrogenase [Peptostreptococcus faecalis]